MSEPKKTPWKVARTAGELLYITHGDEEYIFSCDAVAKKIGHKPYFYTNSPYGEAIYNEYMNQGYPIRDKLYYKTIKVYEYLGIDRYYSGA